jgi:hypothetical protein
MTHQTPAPTAAEVERLARKMCEIAGFDPDESAPLLCVPSLGLHGWGPRWKTLEVHAECYLLARAAHRALMLEEMAQADAPFLEGEG